MFAVQMQARAIHKERGMLLLTFLVGLGAGMGIAIYFTSKIKITKSLLPFLIVGIVFFLIGIVLVGFFHP